MTNLLLKIFVNESQNPEKPSVRASIGIFSGVVGILCNLLLFTLKLTVGILSGSVSITADAMNNLSDATSSIVTLFGFFLAKLPADREHPYGHARYEYLSGLAVAAIIIVIGFELAKSSVEKIISPVSVAFTTTVYVVLVASVLIKLWLFFFYKKLGKKINSTTLLATALDSRNDIFATVAVLVAGTIEAIWGWQVDGYIGLAVAIFVLISGILLAKKTISPLIGENASPELVASIVDIISECNEVLDFHDLMVHDYGPGQRFASVHIEMDYRTDPLLCHELIDAMERRCFMEHSINLIIHYDPVITDDESLKHLKDIVKNILKDINPEISIHDFRISKTDNTTRLIFDAELPHKLFPEKDKIKQKLDLALPVSNNEIYETVITFDMSKKE